MRNVSINYNKTLIIMVTNLVNKTELLSNVRNVYTSSCKFKIPMWSHAVGVVGPLKQVFEGAREGVRERGGLKRCPRIYK